MRIMIVLAALAAGCSSPPSGGVAAPRAREPSAADREVAAQLDRFFEGYLAFRPGSAVSLGLHAHDGKVADRSPAALAAERGRLEATLASLTAVDPTPLSAARRLDLAIVLAEVRKELFELSVRRRPWRDPFYYLRGFSLNPYIARAYAPATERAAAMLRACEQGPAYYQQAHANLEPNLPRPWLQIGIGVSGGTIDFLAGDAKQAFADLPDAALRGRLDACLDTLGAAVATFRDALKARIATGTDDFRIGGETLIAMLREGEGVTTDLASLEAMARKDLERNFAAIETAARSIDPTRPPAAVIAEVSADKPAPDAVLAEATAQLVRLRKFIVDKDLVEIPRPDPIEVRASPPFMRGNFAALGGVGPFERTPLPSYFYIAPPDPTWPEAEQRAYLPSRADLLFQSAHEVWPGHFVQGMHQRAYGSRFVQAFETNTASEGWAHYVEEMMWEQGLGERDPRVHIGQLKNALLRNVRFVVALGYHAGTLTVEQATQLFATQAFADPGNARQQAMRGTVDPMFLGYTLGKLLIRQLRDDWLAAHPGKRLRDFHDVFLRHGEAPLGFTRAAMMAP